MFDLDSRVPLITGAATASVFGRLPKRPDSKYSYRYRKPAGLEGWNARNCPGEYPRSGARVCLGQVHETSAALGG